jgi:hypothetical protein
MAQPFQCLCGTKSCRGTIGGAKEMTPAQLEGYWLSGHIRELLEEQHRQKMSSRPGNDKTEDATAQALKDALSHAEKVVEAARIALRSYVGGLPENSAHQDITGGADSNAGLNGNLGRRGPTSRELSGEMGGDTVLV